MADKNIDLQKILARDPVAEAEKLLGVRLNTPEAMANRDIGLAFLQHAASVNKQKDEALKLLDDTSFSNTLVNYQRIIGEMGFRQVLVVPFGYEAYGGRRNESFFIYWRDDGLLLSFDTFGGTDVNGGKVYYNWRPRSGITSQEKNACMSSGSWNYVSEEAQREIDPQRPAWEVWDASHKGDAAAQEAVKRYQTLFNLNSVWAGDHDCRQALRHNIGKLEQFGSFVVPWVSRTFMWLLHHGDTRNEGYDHNRITAERMAMLPEDVRRAIGETRTG